MRVCNGTTAGVQNCPNGCTNGRGCNQCSDNGVQCINGNTIRRCAGGFFQDTFCQLGCNQGATTCNTCQGNGTSCLPNGMEQRCAGGQFQTRQCPMGCVAGQCASCNGAQCQGDQIRDCNNGQLGGARSCDDGNACNGAERCANNRCTIVGQPLRCDDGNPCTNDSCTAATGCVHSNNANSCDDGDACNGPERCSNGNCTVVGQPLRCNDNNPCTDDGCSNSACVFRPNDNNSCGDGDICKGLGCQDGSCVQTTSVGCFDGDDCTDDICVPFQGCAHPPNQEQGCIPCGGPSCAGSVFTSCDNGRQGAPLDCGIFGLGCRVDQGGCTEVCSQSRCVSNGLQTFHVPCNGGLPGPTRTCAPNESCNDVNGCFLFVIP